MPIPAYVFERVKHDYNVWNASVCIMERRAQRYDLPRRNPCTAGYSLAGPPLISTRPRHLHRTALPRTRAIRKAAAAEALGHSHSLAQLAPALQIPRDSFRLTVMNSSWTDGQHNGQLDSVKTMYTQYNVQYTMTFEYMNSLNNIMMIFRTNAVTVLHFSILLTWVTQTKPFR